MKGQFKKVLNRSRYRQGASGKGYPIREKLLSISGKGTAYQKNKSFGKVEGRAYRENIREATQNINVWDGRERVISLSKPLKTGIRNNSINNIISVETYQKN